MKPWLLSFLACQECGAELTESEAIERRDQELWTGTLACLHCQLLWPVLGGVPFIVHDPGEYLARYREAVLSTLVEYESASQEALRLVDDFAQGNQVEVMRFGDDWTAQEAGREQAPLGDASEALLAYQALCELNNSQGLESTVLRMLGDETYGALVEVGPGAGGLSEKLAERCDTLVLVDLSLRSLLRSSARASTQRAEVACVLGDAADLELAPDKASRVIAANVVDLLDEPERFLSSVCRWLVAEGQLLLTSPNPSLGTEDDNFLGELLEALDYCIEESCDAVPWLREHGARYAQIYWLRAIRASI